jgi:nicotinamide riboside kinase
MIIALLGAESTGKTALAHALALQLQLQGKDAVAVDEYLRDWCAAQGRTPHQHEQAGIAAKQQQLIAAAAAQHSVVVADTTALMTAVYSDYVFADRSLYAQAAAQHAIYDMTLVTGLDVPWQPDGIQRDGEHARAPVDALLRDALHQAKIVYSTVYGLGQQRLDSAMNCIAEKAVNTWTTGQNSTKQWAAMCDKCSDPDCEHLLFTQLTQTASDSKRV